MGHYDDARDRDDERLRELSRAAAEKGIPLVIEDLEAARHKIRVGAHHIRHSQRIEGDLSFIIAALVGQIKRPDHG